MLLLLILSVLYGIISLLFFAMLLRSFLITMLAVGAYGTITRVQNGVYTVNSASFLLR